MSHQQGILKCRVSGQQRWRSDSSGCIMQVLTAFFSFCIFCPSLFILTDIWMFSLSFLYVYIYISVLCCLYIYCFCTNFKMFMCIINASFLTLHIFSYYNYDHPTSLAFKFCWLSNYCMWLCIVLITNYISFKFF